MVCVTGILSDGQHSATFKLRNVGIWMTRDAMADTINAIRARWILWIRWKEAG